MSLIISEQYSNASDFVDFLGLNPFSTTILLFMALFCISGTDKSVEGLNFEELSFFVESYLSTGDAIVVAAKGGVFLWEDSELEVAVVDMLIR